MLKSGDVRGPHLDRPAAKHFAVGRINKIIVYTRTSKSSVPSRFPPHDAWRKHVCSRPPSHGDGGVGGPLTSMAPPLGRYKIHSKDKHAQSSRKGEHYIVMELIKKREKVDKGPPVQGK